MKKQNRNDRCHCGSGLKYKDCCGKINPLLEKNYSKEERKKKGTETRFLYEMFKSEEPEDYKRKGLPNFRDLDFIKTIIECWDSDQFKDAVHAIDGKQIDENQMAEKKEQLLNISEDIKMQAELRFFILHTPHYNVIAYHIPKQFYQYPTIIAAYELYADPVSIELRTYGSLKEIDQAIKSKKFK